MEIVSGFKPTFLAIQKRRAETQEQNFASLTRPEISHAQVFFKTIRIV